MSKNRRSNLKTKYGMSLENYDSLRKVQKYRCKICKIPEKVLGEDLVVDHDHSTGEVRGLLCRLCNSGLGMFKDSPKRLIRAVAYLKYRKNLSESQNYVYNVFASAISDMDYSRVK